MSRPFESCWILWPPPPHTFLVLSSSLNFVARRIMKFLESCIYFLLKITYSLPCRLYTISNLLSMSNFLSNSSKLYLQRPLQKRGAKKVKFSSSFLSCFVIKNRCFCDRWKRWNWEILIQIEFWFSDKIRRLRFSYLPSVNNVPP